MDTAVQFGDEAVLSALDAVVNMAGPDYVYSPGVTDYSDKVCVYQPDDRNLYGCIVNAVFTRLAGEDMASEVLWESDDNAKIALQGYVSERMGLLLNLAQRWQDDEVSWGACRDSLNKRYYGAEGWG